MLSISDVGNQDSIVTSRLPRVLVAQIGARRHYLVPRALEHAGLLDRLVTDACMNLVPWRWLGRPLTRAWSPQALRRFASRRVDGIPDRKISGFPRFALSAAWDRRPGESATSRWARRNAAFGRLVVEAGLGSADTLYAFNGAALEILRHARECGLRTILDQTAAPWRWNRELLLEERRRWPGWEDEDNELDASGALGEREEAEWELADRIVCGSQFAADAVVATGGAADKCTVLPYPIETSQAKLRKSRSNDGAAGRKLRLLFVGTLQLRKGIPYFMQALERIDTRAFKARLVGSNRLSDRATKELARRFELTSVMPRSQLHEQYAWADIFILPTLSEGSANVCYEAMAAGLPVITTPNAGSVVEHERQGLIVPVCDPAALAAAIERLASDAALRQRLGRAASERAATNGIQSYANALSGIIATS